VTNIVFIATSLDGYIAPEDGSLDWLETVPNPEGDDLGFNAFISRVDALVMGRLTFEVVEGFGIGWHYPVPGIILSNTLTALPEDFQEKTSLTRGTPEEVMAFARSKGFENLYIDGGTTIQQFLQADLIDELIITEIPILLGGGDRLFGTLQQPLIFNLQEATTHPNQLVTRHYLRNRQPENAETS